MSYNTFTFKDEATELMIGIRYFHEYSLFYLIIIFVTYLLGYLCITLIES